MKVLVLGLVCIVWLQSSCSAPKWTGHKYYGVFFVDDSDSIMDNDVSLLKLLDMELKGKTGHPQELKDPNYCKTEPLSVFWTVMTALRGIYVLWMLQVFCSWYMEPMDTDCSDTTDGCDTGPTPADGDAHGAENLDDATPDDHSEDDGSDTGGSPADEGHDEDLECSASLEDDGNDTDLSSAEEDPKELPVESAFEEDVVIQVVQVMVDVVSVAEKLVEDVAIAVDIMQVGDGSPQKPSVDPSIELVECPMTVTDVSDMVDAIKQVECGDVRECSSLSEGSSSDVSIDTTERVQLMSRIEKAFLMRSRPPDDIAVPGTSGEVVEQQTDGKPVPDPDGKKRNFFRRAQKAFKKRMKGKKKKPPPSSSSPPEPKTLEQINQMWMQEKAPYLRQIPKIRFRQQVEVKTFLVHKPMDRYQNKPKKVPSEMTQIEPLKREGDFVEVGLLSTKKSFTHRLLRGAMKLAFRKG